MDLLLFILLIGSLILVHEFGHFLVARVFGVRVLTFSIGVGPKLLRFRGKETEYCLSWIPVGGYVRLLEASRGAVSPRDAGRPSSPCR